MLQGLISDWSHVAVLYPAQDSPLKFQDIELVQQSTLLQAELQLLLPILELVFRGIAGGIEQ